MFQKYIISIIPSSLLIYCVRYGTFYVSIHVEYLSLFKRTRIKTKLMKAQRETVRA